MKLKIAFLAVLAALASPAAAQSINPAQSAATVTAQTQCSINGGPTTSGANCNIGNPQKTRVIWVSAESPLYKALIFTNSSAVCGYWTPGSAQCTYAQQYFLGQPQDATLVFARYWGYSSRAAIYGANTATLPLATLKAITAGSLNFTVSDPTLPFGPWNVTGINLSTATAMGPGTVSTTAAGLIQTAINAYPLSAGNPGLMTTVTGTIAQKTCTSTGYNSGTTLVITAMGTCNQIYPGATYAGSSISCSPSPCYLTAQLSGSDGLPCPPSPPNPSTVCNGQLGVYNAFVTGGTTVSETITFTYSLLTFTSASPAVTSQEWVQGAGVANPTATWELGNASETGCSGFTSNNCWVVTSQGAVGPVSMNLTWPKMQVSYSQANLQDVNIPINEFYIARDGAFPPDQSTMSYASSGADGLATLIGWTQASGAFLSSPGIAGCVNCESWWLNTFTNNYYTGFSTHQQVTAGPFLPPGFSSQPGTEQGMLNWAGNTSGRYPYLNYLGPITEPIAPPNGTNYFLILSGGGNSSTPVNNANRFALMNGGYSGGVSATFSAVSSQAGLDYLISNISAEWPSGAAAPGTGATYWAGIDRAGNDIQSPVVQDSQVAVTGTATPISASTPIQTAAPSPAQPTVAVSMTDKIAWEYVPSTSVVPTAPAFITGLSAIGKATWCACSVVYGGGSGTALDNTGATQYLGYASLGTPQATENNASIVMPAPGQIVGMTVDLPAATTGTAGWTFTLVQNGTPSATWKGVIAGTNSTTNTKSLTLCAVPMNNCTVTLPPLAFKNLDTFALQSVSANTPTAQTATISLAYMPSQPGTSFLFWQSTAASPTAASNAFFSPSGLTPTTTTTEVPLQWIPNLTGHSAVFSNMVAVEYFTTAAEIFNVVIRANTANATTTGNCLVASGFTIGDTSAANTAGCQNNTDTYTAASFDADDIEWIYSSGTNTNVSKMKGSMVVTVQ